MSGYDTRQISLQLGQHSYSIRALSDRQQLADPHRKAERLGISATQWSLFGQLWPACKLLAEAMDAFDIKGKRILEVGCGLGLASLVLQRRGADIVPTDHHPLAESFLAHNAKINALPTLAYQDLPWHRAHPSLGRFDLIIASEVLQEREQAAPLLALIGRHANPCCEVLITDPGLGSSEPFTRGMLDQGYELHEIRCRLDQHDPPPFRGSLLSYRRSSAKQAAKE